MTKGDAYWAEKVHIPASAWVAAGARGQPVVATAAAVEAHVLGVQDTLPPEHDAGDTRKRQSNRDRKQARKRRVQADMEELRSFRQGGQKAPHQSGSTGGKDSGGKGKMKSKDQAGTPICFSWSSGTGVCGSLPPGSDSQTVVKRAHKCRKCLSPAHKDADCLK